MSLFRASREKRGPDRFLEAKIGLFVVGAVLGLVGMMTERREVVWAAAVVLFIGVLLRFLPRKTKEE